MNTIAASDKVSYHGREQALLKAHASLVKRIAHHLLVRLPRTIQLDDLIQTGMMGLLDAIKHYDDSKGASFETYASIRIRGCMLDDIRANDWVPRSVYRNARLIAQAVLQVEHRLGRTASDSDIANELHLTLAAYFELLKDSAGSQLYGFDDVGVTDDALIGEGQGYAEPQAHALKTDREEQLAQVIAGLPKKERLVLSLYYEQDLNLKEIGDVLGVSESRVSQIHTQATLRMKARLPADV